MTQGLGALGDVESPGRFPWSGSRGKSGENET